LNEFKEIWKDFEFQTEVWTSPKIRVWTLVQGFNSKDFELQIKDILGPNKGFRIEKIWIRLRIWIQRKDWILSKNGNYKEDFEVLSKLKNGLDSDIKFESMDLIQIKGYLNSWARFWLKCLSEFRKV
jgi:hypothetical protein